MRKRMGIARCDELGAALFEPLYPRDEIQPRAYRSFRVIFVSLRTSASRSAMSSIRATARDR